MKAKSLLILAASAVVAASSGVAQTTYNGNGATGFGGAVGNGSVTVSDTATSMTVTFNRGTGNIDNDLVLYLDTQSGGFADTSQFSDNGDGGRTAISGASISSGTRTVATFASGFGADYAISIENSFIGVFGLAAGGNNSFNYLFGTAQSGVDSDASYSITLSAAQMAMIGLTAGSGQTFSFVGSFISDTAYRANETIGASVTTAGDGSGNAGFSMPQTFSQSLGYQLSSTPEPSTLALLGVFGAGALLVLRRRQVA
jgi:hypothetical protein